MSMGKEQPLPEDFWSSRLPSSVPDAERAESVYESHLDETSPEPEGGNRRNFVNDFPAGIGMGPDAPIWPLYNNKAEKYDKEMLETCNGGMDNLLIFAALFSAVVTAFLILSLPLLQPDTAQAAVDGITVLSMQLASLRSTTVGNPPAYQAQPFAIPASALAVNALWLLSLVLSLSTSVLAMLVKQWLRIYDTDLPSSPRERAHQRQVRFDGLRTWRVLGIAGSLPIFIHVAVALFLCGFIVYLWGIALPLGALLCALFGAGCAGYLFLAVAPLVWLQCPYKSPLTVVLYSGWGWLMVRYRMILRTGKISRTELGDEQDDAMDASDNLDNESSIESDRTTKFWNWRWFCYIVFKAPWRTKLGFWRSAGTSRRVVSAREHNVAADESALAWLLSQSSDMAVQKAIAAACFSWENYPILQGKTQAAVRVTADQHLRSVLPGRRADSPTTSWMGLKSALIELAIARTFNSDTEWDWSYPWFNFAWPFPVEQIPEPDRLLYYALLLHIVGSVDWMANQEFNTTLLSWLNEATDLLIVAVQDPSSNLSSFGCWLFMAYLGRECKVNRNGAHYEQALHRLREPVLAVISTAIDLPIDFLHQVMLLWGSDETKREALQLPDDAHLWLPVLRTVSKSTGFLQPLIQSRMHWSLESAAISYAVNEMRNNISDSLDPDDGITWTIAHFRSRLYFYPHRKTPLGEPNGVARYNSTDEDTRLLECCLEILVSKNKTSIYNSVAVEISQLIDVGSDLWHQLFPRSGLGFSWTGHWDSTFDIALQEFIHFGRIRRCQRSIIIAMALLRSALAQKRHDPIPLVPTALPEWLHSLVEFGFVEVILRDQERCDVLWEVLLRFVRDPTEHAHRTLTSSGIMELLGVRVMQDDLWLQAPFRDLMYEYDAKRHNWSLLPAYPLCPAPVTWNVRVVWRLEKLFSSPRWGRHQPSDFNIIELERTPLSWMSWKRRMHYFVARLRAGISEPETTAVMQLDQLQTGSRTSREIQERLPSADDVGEEEQCPQAPQLRQAIADLESGNPDAQSADGGEAAKRDPGSMV